MDWVFFAQSSVTASKLLVVELDAAIEGFLLPLHCPFLHCLVAWCHELECEVFSQATGTDRCDCDAFKLIPVVVGRFVVEVLGQLLLRNYSVQVGASRLESE